MNSVVEFEQFCFWVNSQHSSGAVGDDVGLLKLLIGTHGYPTLTGCPELVCNVYLEID